MVIWLKIWSTRFELALTPSKVNKKKRFLMYIDVMDHLSLLTSSSLFFSWFILTRWLIFVRKCLSYADFDIFVSNNQYFYAISHSHFKSSRCQALQQYTVFHLYKTISGCPCGQNKMVTSLDKFYSVAILLNTFKKSNYFTLEIFKWLSQPFAFSITSSIT